jgi:hypothetical protein
MAILHINSILLSENPMNDTWKSRNFDSNSDFPEELKFEMGQRYLHTK